MRRAPRTLARAAAAGLVLALAGGALGACGLVKQGVSQADCDRWAAHFEAKMTAYVDGFDGCRHKGAQAAARSSIAPYVVAVREECGRAIGRLQYRGRDERCYLDHVRGEDWRACDFSATVPFAAIGTAADQLEARTSWICRHGVE